MKTLLTMIAALTFVATAQAATVCSQEILAKTLADRIKNSDVEALEKSDFSVSEFGPLQMKGYDYYVTTEAKRRDNGIGITIPYAVKVINAKTCQLRLHLLAD